MGHRFKAIRHPVFFPENVIQTFFAYANVLIRRTHFNIHYILKDSFEISGMGIKAAFFDQKCS